MPIYEYVCPCGFEWYAEHAEGEIASEKCPDCGVWREPSEEVDMPPLLGEEQGRE